MLSFLSGETLTGDPLRATFLCIYIYFIKTQHQSAGKTQDPGN